MPQGSGGIGGAHAEHCPPTVTNATLLPVPPAVTATADDETARALVLIQLDYAQKVATASAAAYAAILQTLRGQSANLASPPAAKAP